MRKILSIVLIGFIGNMVACEKSVHEYGITINENQKESQTIFTSVVFQKITDGRMKEKKIILTNETQDKYDIVKFRPSCNCSSIVMEATSIRPKSKMNLWVRFNPGNRKVIKKYNETIQLIGRKRLTIKFAVSAEVSPNVEYNPPVVAFTSNENESEKREIEVRLNNFQSTKITKIEAPKGYTIIPEFGDRFNEKNKITIQREPGPSEGTNLTANIYCESGDSISISIIEMPDQPFLVQPPLIHFMVINSNDSLVQWVNIKSVVGTNDRNSLQYSCPCNDVSILKVNPPVKGALETIQVKLNTAMIDSSTKSFFIVSDGTCEQKIPLWITKI